MFTTTFLFLMIPLTNVVIGGILESAGGQLAGPAGCWSVRCRFLVRYIIQKLQEISTLNLDRSHWVQVQCKRTITLPLGVGTGSKELNRTGSLSWLDLNCLNIRSTCFWHAHVGGIRHLWQALICAKKDLS